MFKFYEEKFIYTLIECRKDSIKKLNYAIFGYHFEMHRFANWKLSLLKVILYSQHRAALRLVCFLDPKNYIKLKIQNIIHDSFIDVGHGRSQNV